MASLGAANALCTDEGAHDSEHAYVLGVAGVVDVHETEGAHSINQERYSATLPCLLSATGNAYVNPPAFVCTRIGRPPKTRLRLQVLVHALANGPELVSSGGGRSCRSVQCVHGGGGQCLQPLHLRSIERRLNLAAATGESRRLHEQLGVPLRKRRALDGSVTTLPHTIVWGNTNDSHDLDGMSGDSVVSAQWPASTSSLL